MSPSTHTPHRPTPRRRPRTLTSVALAVALSLCGVGFAAVPVSAQSGSAEPPIVEPVEEIHTPGHDESDPGPETDADEEQSRRRTQGWRRMGSFDAVVGNEGAVTIRLVDTTGVESLRATLRLVAADLTRITGLKVTVAPGTVSTFTPSKGEIRVRMGTSAGCTGSWDGCGGPRGITTTPSGRKLIRSGVVTIKPSVRTTYSASDLRLLLSHELGHTFNLDHFNSTYRGEYQVMRTPLPDRPATYGSGDTNGLRSMTPYQTRRAYDLDCDGTKDKVTYDGRNLTVAKSSTGRNATTDWGQWFTRVLVPGDLDGDLMPDVIGITAAGKMYIFQGSCNGAFPAYTSGSPAGTFTQKAIAASRDFTGDGRSDLFVVAADGRLLMRSWNGSAWGNWVQLATGWTDVTELVMSGDRNGDGFDDLYARRTNGSLTVYWGNGRGGFQNPLGSPA